MAITSVPKKALGVFALSVLFVLFLSFTPKAHGQASSPQFLVTWKSSGSYIPSFYQGKALPTYGSKIIASLELLSGGKILNLNSQTIYWYADENLVGSGQQVTFSPLGQPPSSLTLKIELPSYNGSFLVHAVQIPSTLPEAVIYAPYPNGQFSNNPLNLIALPYFFNTANPSNLSFSWAVNGQTGTNAENPNQAQIILPQSTPAGTTFGVSLTIQNSIDSTSATDQKNLTYQTQL